MNSKWAHSRESGVSYTTVWDQKTKGCAHSNADLLKIEIHLHKLVSWKKNVTEYFITTYSGDHTIISVSVMKGNNI